MMFLMSGLFMLGLCFPRAYGEATGDALNGRNIPSKLQGKASPSGGNIAQISGTSLGGKPVKIVLGN